jgi:adenosine deaminase
MTDMAPGSTRNRDEWDKLAKWVVNNKLLCDNVRWLIQIPRLYEVFKASGTVDSFGDVLQSTSRLDRFTQSDLTG